MSEPAILESTARPPAVTVRRVQDVACEVFDLPLSRLIGPERCRYIAHPRAVAMYLARRLTSASYPEIADAFGGRDHTTVLASVRKIARLVVELPGFRTKVAGIARAIAETPRKVA